MQATTSSALKILFLMVIPIVFCTAVWDAEGEGSSAPSQDFIAEQPALELGVGAAFKFTIPRETDHELPGAEAGQKNLLLKGMECCA